MTVLVDASIRRTLGAETSKDTSVEVLSVWAASVDVSSDGIASVLCSSGSDWAAARKSAESVEVASCRLKSKERKSFTCIPPVNIVKADIVFSIF